MTSGPRSAQFPPGRRETPRKKRRPRWKPSTSPGPVEISRASGPGAAQKRRTEPRTNYHPPPRSAAPRPRKSPTRIHLIYNSNRPRPSRTGTASPAGDRPRLRSSAQTGSSARPALPSSAGSPAPERTRRRPAQDQSSPPAQARRPDGQTDRRTDGRHQRPTVAPAHRRRISPEAPEALRPSSAQEISPKTSLFCHHAARGARTAKDERNAIPI